MTNEQHKHPIIFRLFSVIAIVFGLLTIKSGGMVLFTSGEAHQAAGNYVPFVLWFNFIAGFVYIAAGVGLWKQRRCAWKLATAIAAATAFVFLAFGVYIFNNGAYEIRTVVAMTIRSSLWFTIALVTFMLGRGHEQSR